MPEKFFPTRNVLALVTGHNLGDMNGMGDVLDYMAGESISGMMVGMTLGIPQAKVVLLKRHPHLAQAEKEADEFLNEGNLENWVNLWIARYGETISVPANSLSPEWEPTT